MSTFEWPIEMAPRAMSPNGPTDLYNYLRLNGLLSRGDDVPNAPPVWPVPQSSPDWNDPDNWLGDERNALNGRRPMGGNALSNFRMVSR